MNCLMGILIVLLMIGSYPAMSGDSSKKDTNRQRDFSLPELEQDLQQSHRLHLSKIAEQVVSIIREKDTGSLLSLFNPDGVLLAGDPRFPLNTIRQMLGDKKDILHCVLFDTACARSFFQSRAKRVPPQLADTELGKSRVFRSVRDIFASVDYKPKYEIKFRQDTENVAYIIYRVPDAISISGLPSSLTLTLVTVNNRWMIDQVFPEVT